MLLLASGVTSRADEQLTLKTTIDVGGKGLGAFDISYVDPKINLYVLADRTNASVDFFDASDAKFMVRVGGFQGVVLTATGAANNDRSGPDGVVVVAHKEVWAGDGDSTLKVIDIKTAKIVDTISTGGMMRVDEMDWDARDHILAVANDADTPPFITLVNTDNHKIIATITFDGTNGTPNAPGGIEQTKWSPETGMFYTSVPQIDTKDPAQGGVAVIDPHSMKVVRIYPVKNCSPAGLALGPSSQALLGCSASFGTSPNVLTQSLVINIKSGEIAASLPQIGGSDEVWYDPGSGHYYLAARSNADSSGKVSPVLGFVDARSNMFDGSVPTSTTAHSVAADPYSHNVFVPIGFVPPGSPAGTDPTNPCPTNGCIAVYLPSSIDQDHDHDHGERQASR
jgi:hypothetical protein